jgi:AmiR/NasT family two-component response regulator
MSEGDAFSFIQRTAMQERMTMKAISEQIIAGELEPPPTN